MSECLAVHLATPSDGLPTGPDEGGRLLVATMWLSIRRMEMLHSCATRSELGWFGGGCSALYVH
jgi:hypothetical protein